MKVNEIALIEATWDLDEDVDWLYNKYFKDTIDAILNNSWDGEYSYEKIGYSNILKSPDAQKAHKVNPVVIYKDDENTYSPQEQRINIGINHAVLSLIRSYGSIGAVLEELPQSQRRQFKIEITPSRIKGSIHHELTHWIDDSLYNRHIYNTLEKAAKYHYASNKHQNIRNHGEKDINLTSFERNAQINSIKQVKREHEDIWDLLSFEEMLELNSSLISLANNFKELGVYEKWKKLMLKRMAREGLLGEEMSHS